MEAVTLVALEGTVNDNPIIIVRASNTVHAAILNRIIDSIRSTLPVSPSFFGDGRSTKIETPKMQLLEAFVGPTSKQHDDGGECED